MAILEISDLPQRSYDGDILRMQAGETGVRRLEELAIEMAAAPDGEDQSGQEAAISSITASCPEPAEIAANFQG